MPQSTKTRITKAPAERKRELVHAAQRLFLEKGYENTAVSDIVKAVNVAQGTFYYHFKSKADLLEAVVENINTSLEQDIRSIVNQNNTDAAIQLNALINQLLSMRKTNRDLLAVIHEPSNVALHQKLMAMLSSMMVPFLESVISAGVNQGCFNVPYPQEAALALMGSLDYLLHLPETEPDPRHTERVRATLEHVLARVLGINGYTFNLEF
jgi:AcrR family transcriptional regulator